MKIALLSMVLAQQQICLEPSEARYVAQYIERTEAENASLKKDIQAAPSIPLVVVISVAAGLLVGGGVGAGIALAATQRK